MAKPRLPNCVNGDLNNEPSDSDLRTWVFPTSLGSLWAPKSVLIYLQEKASISVANNSVKWSVAYQQTLLELEQNQYWRELVRRYMRGHRMLGIHA